MTRLRKLALAAPLALTVSLLILGGSGAATAARSSQAEELGVGPAHWYKPGAYGNWGDGPDSSSATVLQSRLRTFAVDNLKNPGNGEIMPTTRTHLIFWLPAGFHYSSSLGDANYENLMIRYFQDIGGSQILNTATQYTGNNGAITNTSTFVDSIVDTNAFPHTGADVAHAVTQGDLNSEIFTQIGLHSGWNKGMSEMYFIFLPDNLVDCNNALTSCNTNRYCAYHTYGYSGSDTPANDFVWANIPDNRSVYSTVAGCGDSNVTGDRSADTTLSSVEHEHLEAVTDPRLNAWQDSSGGGGENGDKCNRDMGVANSSSSIANNFLGGGAAHAFRIQREWSNAVSGCAASYTTTGSGVESPVPTGSDVTEAVTEATIAGNNGDTLHYSTSFRNPSNQDDAYSITITDTLPTGVSGSSSFSLGNLAPHRTVSQSFTDTVSGGPLLDGTVLTNSAKFDFRDSTTAAQPSITRSASTTVSNASPALVLPGAQSQDYHDGLSFGISATDANAGDTVSLSASGLPAGLSFTDNGDRTGTVSGTISAAPGPYTVMFTANDHHHLTMVTQSLVITVLREETTTTYTGVTGAVLDGSTVTLSGVLNEDGTTPISAATLTMTLGSGATAQTCFGTTNAAGSASCDIVVHQSVGPKPVSATFAGDVFYLGSSGSGSVVIFTAKSLKQDTLAQATALLAGAAKRDSENLETVVKKLTDALTPSLWVDGNHVDSHQGGKVFDREKEVVSTLESIIKNKKSAIPDATSQAMIDALVHADRILAEDALADAVAATGDPKRIAEAQRELVRAAAELAVGDFDGAIENYKGCWKKAQDAV